MDFPQFLNFSWFPGNFSSHYFLELYSELFVIFMVLLVDVVVITTLGVVVVIAVVV